MEYQPPTTQRKGWSCWLTGLLVGCGCAIIMIPVLAAILFPVFAKAREAARKATCQNNLKELSSAMKMYQGDYDGRMPSSPPGTGDQAFENPMSSFYSPGRAKDWVVALHPTYAKQRRVFKCPTDRSTQVSYCYKHAVNLAAKANLKESDFAHPDLQVVLYERQSFHWGGGPILEGSTVNVAYMDCHVKSMAMKDVGSDGEPEYFNHADTSNAKSATMKRPYWDPRYCYDELN